MTDIFDTVVLMVLPSLVAYAAIAGAVVAAQLLQLMLKLMLMLLLLLQLNREFRKIITMLLLAYVAITGVVADNRS